MTVFLTISNDNVQIEGMLPAHIQAHEYLVIDEKSKKNLENTQLLHNVETGKHQKGALLLSGKFNPCVAVVACFKNDEMALYHAHRGHTGLTGIGQASKDASQFFTSIKNEVKTIYIFQKSQTPDHSIRANEIAVAISKIFHSDPEIPINCIVLNNYQHILCDAKKNQISLFNDIEIVDNILDAQHDNRFSNVGQHINTNQSITIEVTAQNVIDNRKALYKDRVNINEEGDMVYPDGLIIPKKLIPPSYQVNDIPNRPSPI
ncbi:MAG: hypothetical protein KIT56_01670 [Gammaproteobacteria bacterium]|nr:hypothetical protein [Gammaproteobacteria bacterium]MCW5582592.1 hypothetical protein [Gammaproteobacteria bacterium]